MFLANMDHFMENQNKHANCLLKSIKMSLILITYMLDMARYMVQEQKSGTG